MEYIPVFVIMFLVVAFISWRWVEGIDYMQKNHPDYKGEDFLDWGDDEHRRAAAGRDGWDDWHPNENL
jgi:hypothetical protein